MSGRNYADRAEAARQQRKALREVKRKLPAIIDTVEQAEEATRTPGATAGADGE